jgi:hypothetical protein
MRGEHNCAIKRSKGMDEQAIANKKAISNKKMRVFDTNSNSNRL